MKRATAGVMHAKTSSVSTMLNRLSRSLLDRIRIAKILLSKIRNCLIHAQ